MEIAMNPDAKAISESNLSELSESDSVDKQNGLTNTFIINRPVYTQHDFDEDHGAKMTKISFRNRIKKAFRKFKRKKCSKQGLCDTLVSSFPIYTTMRKYKWREWIVGDLIAGIIVGIMHIPQSMAYALLAGLKPMYGLYVSFFPSFIYFLFGTSRHISIGTIAIVSLLTGKFLDNSLSQFPLKINSTLSTNSDISPIDQKSASRVAGFCLMVGFTQLLMGVLKLGYMTRYLSDPLISGFTVGAAVHVLTSQIKSCFGVKIPKQVGMFNIPMTYYYICAKLPTTNIPTLFLTLTSIIILYINKQFINPNVVKKIKIPIPMELFVVISGTVSSKFLFLESKYNVSVVGKIERGIPFPNIPETAILTSFVTDIIITAVIAFSVCISLAKTFAKKHNYNIDANQDLYAYGLMNIFSSFFYCYPSAASVSRSAVQESVGGKTQLTSIISSTLLLFVLLYIGPLFEALPNCVLSSIIIVALKSIFMQFTELKELWIFSLWDFGTWVITFLATVFLDVEYGLLIGICISILTVMLRTQSPNSHILGQIKGTNLYKNIEVYDKCNEIEGMKIFRYEGSLYYASSEHFKKSLYSKVEVDPKKVSLALTKFQNKLKKIEKQLSKEPINEERFLEKKTQIEQQLMSMQHLKTHHIVIDCSTWGYIDYVGVKTLYQVIEEYKSINVTVLLANPKTDIREAFSNSNFYHLIDDQIIYLSVHDAVVSSLYTIQYKNKTRLQSNTRL